MEYTITELQYVYDNYPKIIFKSQLYYYLIEHTTYLSGKVYPKQRLWHIINNTPEIPKCKNCNKEVKWDDAQPFTKQQYREFCGVSCSRKHKDTHTKKNNTEIERYGIGRAEIIQKTKQTNQERYGADFAIQTDEYKQKQVNTNQERYGTDNVIQNLDVLNKRTHNNIIKYGGAAPACDANIANKAKYTCLLKYGVNHQSIRKYSNNTLSKLNDPNWLENQHINSKKKMSEIATILSVHPATILKYLNKSNIPVQYYSHSSTEQNIANWLTNEVHINIIRNSKGIIPPKEIDIFIPDKNIAIEFNGIYYHSEIFNRDKRYHLSKTIECANKNIRLIHIWDNEWANKQDIVKSRILNALGLSNKIPARKCDIDEISATECRDFLNTNHIQGSCTAKIHLGLKFNNELVGVMTFAVPRFNSKYEYELIRFCSKLGYVIVGGASKLHTYFIKKYKPTSLISYCDIRYGTGNLYKQLGYEFLHNSAPNCLYFHKSNVWNLYSRMKFQKHKLAKELNIFDPLLTETENMKNNGYSRIWDCGNSVWAINLQ